MGQFEELWEERGHDTERLVFFSDAVFAIALTLLVIDVRLPERLVAQDLATALWDLSDTLLALVISFFTISAFWRSHHRMFRVIIGYNPLLITLNFVLLLGIVLVPFTTSLVSQFGNIELAMLIFIANVGFTSLMMTMIWWYASTHQLVDPALSPQSVRAFSLRSALLTLTFLLAIPFTFIIKPVYAPLVWFVSRPLLRPFLRFYDPRTQSKASTAARQPSGERSSGKRR